MTRSARCVLAACAFAALLTGCHKPEPPPVPPPPPVMPLPPATNAVPPVKPAAAVTPLLPEMVATIQGFDEVPVKSPKTGYLVRQVYKDHATVAAGDVLFLLDPRTTHDGTSIDPSAFVPIVAPRAGMPGHAWHGAGDWVDPNMELTGLAEIDTVSAEVSLPTSLANQIAAYLDQSAPAPSPPRHDFELILPDGRVYPERGWAGTMPSSGGVHVLSIYFPNPHHVLQVGEYVKVRSAAAP
jgi:hypothetical protein